MNHSRKLIVLLTSFLLLEACFVSHVKAQEKSKSEKPKTSSSESVSQKQLNVWLNQLSAGNFRERRAASNNLANAGKQALPTLVKGAGRKDAELSARCVAIIIKMYKGKNNALKSAAEKALGELKKSTNISVAQRAKLATQKPPVVPSSRRDWIVLARRVPVRQVPLFKPIRDWSKKISEKGKTTSIVTKNGAISIEVTESINGKIQTKKYKAKNEIELKKKYPELAKLYAKHSNQNFVRFQLINQNVVKIPANNPNPFKNLNTKKRRIEDAEKQWNLALDKLDDIAKANKIDSGKLKKLNVQIQNLRKRLKRLKK